MRRLVLLLVGLTLAGCGSEPEPATAPRVKLELSAPADLASVRAEEVTVSGVVTPADAAVQVAGKTVSVSGGQFSVAVPLEGGSNVIDVTAAATGHRPATAALRVTRDTRIKIPDVVGETPDAAAQDLSDAGLKSTEDRDSDWLDDLFGGFRVCTTTPSAGELVEPGTEITLQTARGC